MNAPPVVIGQGIDGGLGGSGRVGPACQRQSDPHPHMEVTDPDDTFAVYRGDSVYNEDPTKDDPLGYPAVWQYTGKTRFSLRAFPLSITFGKR